MNDDNRQAFMSTECVTIKCTFQQEKYKYILKKLQI